MQNKMVLVKILAGIGTVFVWFPVLSPLLLVLLGVLFRPREFERPLNFDYLMPAELFPIALLGSVLLILAAFLAGHKGSLHRRLIFWGTGTAVVMLFGGQLIAEISGLASGATEPPNIWWDLTLGALAVYVLALVAVGIGGVFLLRDLFRPARRVAVI